MELPHIPTRVQTVSSFSFLPESALYSASMHTLGVRRGLLRAYGTDDLTQVTGTSLESLALVGVDQYFPPSYAPLLTVL